MEWNIFRKQKPKEHSITTANLMTLQSLKELSRLGDILERLFNNNNMETKEMKIVPPEGYEIDKENSTFECVKFKPIKKAVSYRDISEKLFVWKDVYFISDEGKIELVEKAKNTISEDPNNSTSRKQCEKLLAINKLMNVAKYLNCGWKPDWKDALQLKFYIKQGIEVHINVSCVTMTNDINVFFKSEEATQQAIDILGEETIRLALSTDW